MHEVSVIMPVYNGEAYLSEAMESILKQSFADFEFIIIDDGSSDKSPEIIQSFADERIRYWKTHHTGIARALNLGIERADGDLILRMDADDICFQQRLRSQVVFAQEHPAVSIFGSDTELIDESGRVIGYRNTKKGDQRIKIALFFGETSLAHPTVAMRREFLKKYRLLYSETCPHAEDYELWCRCSSLCMFENIPAALVQYRRHSRSVSKTYENWQRLSARKILSEYLCGFGLVPNPEELECHMQFALAMERPDGPPTRKLLAAWRDKLLQWNRRNAVFDPDLFEVELDERYRHAYD